MNRGGRGGGNTTRKRNTKNNPRQQQPNVTISNDNHNSISPPTGPHAPFGNGQPPTHQFHHQQQQPIQQGFHPMMHQQQPQSYQGMPGQNNNFTNHHPHPQQQQQQQFFQQGQQQSMMMHHQQQQQQQPHGMQQFSRMPSTPSRLQQHLQQQQPHHPQQQQQPNYHHPSDPQSMVCASCQKPIIDRFLLKSMNQFWHEDCLICSCCSCRLGEVGNTLYTKANQLFCQRDYLRLFGQPGSCSACHKDIPAFEMVMKVKENKYHLDCFACHKCNHRFCVGDRFFFMNNRVLCENDCEATGQGVPQMVTHGTMSSSSNNNNNNHLGIMQNNGPLSALSAAMSLIPGPTTTMSSTNSTQPPNTSSNQLEIKLER